MEASLLVDVMKSCHAFFLGGTAVLQDTARHLSSCSPALLGLSMRSPTVPRPWHSNPDREPTLQHSREQRTPVLLFNAWLSKFSSPTSGHQNFTAKASKAWYVQGPGHTTLLTSSCSLQDFLKHSTERAWARLQVCKALEQSELQASHSSFQTSQTLVGSPV